VQSTESEKTAESEEMNQGSSAIEDVSEENAVNRVSNWLAPADCRREGEVRRKLLVASMSALLIDVRSHVYAVVCAEQLS